MGLALRRKRELLPPINNEKWLSDSSLTDGNNGDLVAAALGFHFELGWREILQRGYSTWSNTLGKRWNFYGFCREN